MELERYVEGLRSQLIVAAEVGGDEAQALVGKLIAPLESSVRLMLLEALSDAANEITLEMAPGSVEVRLRGRDPELVVIAPPTLQDPSAMTTDDVMMPSADTDDGSTVRITLRLPESLKQRIDDAAARQSLSVNSWLVRAVTSAVEPRGEPGADRSTSTSVSSRFTGWVH